MAFKRVLKQNLINKLNELHDDENSWWHKMVEDDSVFILIRNNRLHVLANGGLLLQVSMDYNNKLVCKTHEEFLSLRSENNPYVVLSEDKTLDINRVEGLKDLAKHYSKVKHRIKHFTGREKRVVQDFALDIKQIIDLEIGLEGEKKETALKKGAQRIDMAGISDNNMLVFFEVKLFNNSEIRSLKKPRIVSQLNKYDNLLREHCYEILNGYKDQFKMYAKLKGRFFKSRIRKLERLDLYPKVRLIITDFDGSQKKFLLPRILEGIQNGMNWDDKNQDLITIGNHKNIKMESFFTGV